MDTLPLTDNREKKKNGLWFIVGTHARQYEDRDLEKSICHNFESLGHIS